MKLHIGGEEAKPGWKILNIVDADYVDFVGNCIDLTQFEDGAVEDIYASHVFEHLSYQRELSAAIGECHRILEPGGRLYISVPNLGVLCQLFVSGAVTEKQQWEIMRIMFGGQIDPYDLHKVGFIEPFLTGYLENAGFISVERVSEFDLFDDTSKMRLGPHLISLNVIATR